MSEPSICNNVPTLLSNFVDTFVDFSVSGFFLPPKNSQSASPLRTHHSHQPDRLIAIGDLHGDLEKTRQSFRLAGLIDEKDKWIGGSCTVVQIGDVLDRGGEELRILYLLEKLKREALKSGGNLITMNGNHEIMNVEGDFRYVTEKGFEEFSNWAYWYRVGGLLKSVCSGLEGGNEDIFCGIPWRFPGLRKDLWDKVRARIAAFRPNGPVSRRFLSENLTVAVVGDSVFVHGGLLVKHVDYGLERINEEVRDWIMGMRGGTRRGPNFVRGRNSVVWLRSFSHELANNCDCSALEHVLENIPGVKRMIMGHTIQEVGINGVCNNKAVRIDVGMSRGCINGMPEVLEINGNSELQVLTSNLMYQNKHKPYLDVQRKDGLGLLLPEHGQKEVEVKA